MKPGRRWSQELFTDLSGGKELLEEASFTAKLKSLEDGWLVWLGWLGWVRLEVEGGIFIQLHGRFIEVRKFDWSNRNFRSCLV